MTNLKPKEVNMHLPKKMWGITLTKECPVVYRKLFEWAVHFEKMKSQHDHLLCSLDMNYGEGRFVDRGDYDDAISNLIQVCLQSLTAEEVRVWKQKEKEGWSPPGWAESSFGSLLQYPEKLGWVSSEAYEDHLDNEDGVYDEEVLQ